MRKFLNAIFCLLLFFLTVKSANAAEVFVNKVWYFQETNNFYSKLHLKKELADSISLDDLKSDLDSTITKDYYLTRKRLPVEIAARYFDLDVLNNIDIFNINHELLTSASLLRVEYYEDMIEGMFIAVFENNSPLDLENFELNFYAVSNNANPFFEKGFRHSESTKSQWDKEVKDQIPYKKENLLKSEHIEIKNHGNLMMSILSLQNDDNIGHSTYLIEHKDNGVFVHHELKNDYVFWDMIPVPILKNEKPILILEIIIPETDFTGYVLAEFDGTKYCINHEMVSEI